MTKILEYQERLELISSIFEEAKLELPEPHILQEITVGTINCTAEEIRKMSFFIRNYYPVVQGLKPADKKIDALETKLSLPDIEAWQKSAERHKLPHHVESILSHLIIRLKKKSNSAAPKKISVNFDLDIPIPGATVEQIQEWLNWELHSGTLIDAGNPLMNQRLSPIINTLKFQILR